MFIGHLSELQSTEKISRESPHYIDFNLTIKDVISRIKKGFPVSYKDSEESDFVTKSRSFVTSLTDQPGKLDKVLQTVPNVCEYCNHKLDEWKHKAIHSTKILNSI